MTVDDMMASLLITGLAAAQSAAAMAPHEGVVAAAPDERCRDPLPYVDGHATTICRALADGRAEWIATAWGHSPWPDLNQQIALLRTDEGWHMRVAGVRSEGGRAVVTRRNDFPVTDAEARSIIALADDATIARLAAMPIHGPCAMARLHGSGHSLEKTADGVLAPLVRQHACANNIELGRIMARFREVALRHDPKFEGLLHGFVAP